MKIETFEYHDKSRDWKLEKTSFSDLNLLVGVSGVGKTQILNALLNLKKIAEGESINGVKWDIEFTTNENQQYRWSGEFEVKEIGEIDKFIYIGSEVKHTENKFEIIFESVFKDGIQIVERNKEGIYYNDKITPKLTPSKSALNLLEREDNIKPATYEFWKIQNSALPYTINDNGVLSLFEFDSKLDSFEKLQMIQFEVWLKLSFVYRSYPLIFSKIKERFIEIFPQVTDLTYEIKKYEVKSKIVGYYSVLMIKEKDVSNWIDQNQMSSGMLRTLHHIAELYLCPNGSVILIDEFENSLGVNCIDVITEDILTQNRDLQFIITSHHPYIINNIPPKYWKIVQRKGGVVSTHDAASLGLSDSNHEAFIQLINSDKFREGIEA